MKRGLNKGQSLKFENVTILKFEDENQKFENVLI